MARSYRKPYSTWSGWKSAKWDKVQAHRAVRRMHRQAIQRMGDPEEFIIPHQFEASANDVWGWRRDGKLRLQSIGNKAFTQLGLGDPEWLDHMIGWMERCSRK